MFEKKIQMFEEIEHTADIGIRACGSTIEELFANCAFGLLHLLLADRQIDNSRKNKIRLAGASLQDLLVAWLTEINYLLLVKKFITSKIATLIIKNMNNQFTLHATLLGDINRDIADTAETEIKAVTYHQLHISKSTTGFSGQVIFDI